MTRAKNRGVYDTDVRARIIKAVGRGVRTPTEIAEKIDREPAGLASTIRSLVDTGELVRVERGRYARPETHSEPAARTADVFPPENNGARGEHTERTVEALRALFPDGLSVTDPGLFVDWVDTTRAWLASEEV